jgi:two-component system OmpR family sensor kinase
MDGSESNMSKSLQFRLSAWLSLAIFALALAAGLFSFVLAFQDAHELQDDQLRQVAALINRPSLPIPRPGTAGNSSESDPESRIIVQRLLPQGSLASKSGGELAELPVNLPDDLQTIKVQGISWRLVVKTLDSGDRVAVGQQTAVRDELATNSAVRTVMPFLVLIPVLLLLVSYLIRRIFRPLKSMASSLDQRAEDDLTGIADTTLPSEIRPFVVAINRLLGRVGQSVAMQRRFVADAAHELRSPLTALSLQAERLEAADMSADARARLASLRQGIQRNRGLLDQLLSFARVQESSHGPAETVSVQQVFRHVLEDLMPLAEAKNIDLGVISELDATIEATAVDLATLLKNLVDNAIRYTPDHGRIDLCVQTSEHSVTLQVTDTGPGIAQEERDRVFDAFYRVLGNDEVGSGLGLSIVKTIATRIGATVSLAYANEQARSGLRVSVVLSASSSLGR